MPTKPSKKKLEAETSIYNLSPNQLEAMLRENLDIPEHSVIRFNTGIDEIKGGGGTTSVFKGVVIIVNAQKTVEGAKVIGPLSLLTG